jgi:hypothetical protein
LAPALHLVALYCFLKHAHTRTQHTRLSHVEVHVW